MIYVFILFLIFYSNVAYAYIGPGIGSGIIAATIGVIFAIFAALFGILWFPIKRFFKKKKRCKAKRKTKLILHFFIIIFSIFIYEYLKFVNFVSLLKSNIIIYKKNYKIIKIQKSI